MKDKNNPEKDAFKRELGTDAAAIDKMVFWQCNDLCNFRCEYCFCGDEKLSNEHPECGKYSPDHIAGCFDDTGFIWQVHMSGGEPFLYPKFIELCGKITRKHYISLNTNLSTVTISDFAEKIDPSRVIFINAGFHVKERENKNGTNRFIENVLVLQEKGFNVDVGYLTHPDLLGRMNGDIVFLKNKGVKLVNAKTFRGYYKGKYYPKAYTSYEREIIRSYTLDPREIDIIDKKFNFFGKPCSTGMKYFRMDPSGDLFRCSTSTKSYGNMFTGTYSFDDTPRPCPLLNCDCPYEGFKYVVEGKSGFTDIAGEVVKEICAIPRRGITLRKIVRYVGKRTGLGKK